MSKRRPTSAIQWEGTQGFSTRRATHTLVDADIQAIVHVVGGALGYQNGYNGIFHVFLPRD